MSEKLIDNIFDYKSYRYIPENLKAEWKNLYNLYSGDYFNKQHEIYKIYPQNRIDFYNEEILKLDRVNSLCNSFINNINNLQPKYHSDIKYSQEIKHNLQKSIKKLKKFIKIKNELLFKKVKVNQIPKIKHIEHIENFDQCYNLDNASNNKVPIIITLLLIFIIFYLTFN